MKKRNLNKKFAAIFLTVFAMLFLVLLLVVQIVAHAFTQDYVNGDILNRQRSMTAAVTEILNETSYGYTRMLQSDKLLYLADYSSSYYERSEQFKEILKDSALETSFLNVALVTDYGDVYYGSELYDEPSKSFVREILSTDRMLTLGEVNGKKNYLTLGRKFQSASAGIEGAVVFYVSASAFSEACSAIDSDLGYTFLVDSEYLILAKSDGSDTGKTILEQSDFPLTNGAAVENRTLNGQLCLVASTPADSQYDLKWHFVSVLYYNVLQKDLIVLSWVLTGVAALSFVFAFLFALQLARRTAKPINDLSKEISSADLSSPLGLLKMGTEGDELYELEKSYDEMLGRLFRLVEQNRVNMETQRKLEIDSLQMQINPHFLYNTLDAIAWMAKIKKQPEIEKLVISLAKFFRLSLHKGDKFITVGEEAELIAHFIEIEKIRFPETINFSCEISGEVANYKTLKLILQPLVENSIKHGFAEKQGVGTIILSSYEEDGDVFIRVADDGAGFDVTEDFWTRKASQSGGGYGMKNVNERIKLEYGEEYGLSVESEIGKGTAVTVRIKKRL